jgi:hypothetical protein
MTVMYAMKSWTRKIIFGLGFLAGCSAAALAADSIKGIVRNQSRSRVVSGAEVILLRLDETALNQNMPEEARTETDPQGAFTLDVRHSDNPHLLRVVYQGVDYDEQVSAGDAVSINVYDAVPKVEELTGSIEIIRIGTAGNHLHVSDMIEIRNESNPPLTQAGERTFETYLPAHAKLDSVLAAGPGKIAVLIAAMNLPGEPGHYAVNFPLQPGATKFAFNYDIAYSGHAIFRHKSMVPVQQLAVMIPPTMKFTSPSAAFQILRTGNERYHVEAANMVKAGEEPQFEISGVGGLPAVRAQAQSPSNPVVRVQPVPALSAQASLRSRPQGANDLGPRAAPGILPRSSRMQWWLLGAAAAMLGAGGILLWRRKSIYGRAVTDVVRPPQPSGQAAITEVSMAEVLKEELRQLEIDCSLGTITREDYASARQALEGTVKRVLARTGTG